MILRGIEWKARSLDADSELQLRKRITEENGEDYRDDIMGRDWF